MREFFHGWRRKAGVASLVMACAVTSLWIRSQANLDVVWLRVLGQQFAVNTSPGQLLMFRLDTAHFDDVLWFSMETRSAEGVAIIKSIDHLNGQHPEPGTHYLRIWYWSIVLPLTLLSAYLILWKPRKRVKQDA
jgi:hypothetical protein